MKLVSKSCHCDLRKHSFGITSWYMCGMIISHQKLYQQIGHSVYIYEKTR